MSFFEATIYNVQGFGPNFIESPEFENKNLLEVAKDKMRNRFRGFYPVVVDVETGGFDPIKNPILQVAAQLLSFDYEGKLYPYASLNLHIHPLASDIPEESSLKFIGVNPYDPERQAVSLRNAMDALHKFVNRGQKLHGCSRSVVVAHNASFDHNFIQQSLIKAKSKKEPFHPFVTFDTSTIGALLFGQTRLEHLCQQLNIEYDRDHAHDALYDTEKTTEIFCLAINQVDQSTLNPMSKYNL